MQVSDEGIQAMAIRFLRQGTQVEIVEHPCGGLIDRSNIPPGPGGGGIAAIIDHVAPLVAPDIYDLILNKSYITNAYLSSP